MYNGVEAAAVKGTGLSGYVQRSRVNVTTAGRSAAPLSEDATALEGGDSVNPLAMRRAQAENAEMAAKLEAHRAVRDVRLRVLLYREEREAAGVEPQTVERECEELYTSLLVAARRTLKTQQRAEQAKTAAKFAAAFGVKTQSGAAVGGAEGSAGARHNTAFDRSVQDVEKIRNEEERRQRQEQQLVDHLKRIRREGADGKAE